MKMAVALRTLALLLLDEDENENKRSFMLGSSMGCKQATVWCFPLTFSRIEKRRKIFLGVYSNQFDFLVEKLAPKIIKEDTFLIFSSLSLQPS